MIHFCVATNQLPLKRQGLYCYLDLQVAIVDLGLKVMYSKTAQVVLVEDRVPPEALCLTWRSPSDLRVISLSLMVVMQLKYLSSRLAESSRRHLCFVPALFQKRRLLR